jgi:type I restriction enzyme S subunit
MASASTPVKYQYVVRDVRCGDENERPLLSVSIFKGIVPRSELTDKAARADDLSGYKLVDAGDIVVNRMSAYQGALGIARQDGIVSPEYIVLRSRPSAEARFLAYLFKSSLFVGQMALRVRGIGSTEQGNVRTPRINPEDLGNIPVTMPALGEQRAIADFLDRETARIDALIAAKRRMIEGSVWRLEAERAEVVSVGLSRKVPRPTGHPFFPHIPEGWRLRTLGSTTQPGRPIVYGIVQPGPEVESGVRYVKTGDLPDLDESRISRTSPEIAAAYHRAALRTGDIVVAMRASIGTCAVTPPWLEGGNLTQGTARVAPGRDVDRSWLVHVLRSHPMKEQMLYRSVGTTYQTLNIADLRKITLPVPPPEEQRVIAEHLDGEEARHVALSTSLSLSIDLLGERRSALITAAVTGELDVGVAA